MFMTLILPFKFRPLSSSFSASDSWSEKQKEIKKMRGYLLPRKENDIGVVLLRGQQELANFSRSVQMKEHNDVS